MTTVAERLNPNSPHFEPDLLRLRIMAFPHLYTPEEFEDAKKQTKVIRAAERKAARLAKTAK